MTRPHREQVLRSSLCAVGLAFLLCVAPASADDKWEFMIVPYLWGPGIDGKVTVAGEGADVDASFSDLLEFVDIAGSLRFEAAKGHWGGFGDIWFADLSSETDGGVVGKVKAEVDLVIGEVGGFYRVSKPLNLYLGVRYQDLDTEVRFERLLDPVKEQKSITDAIVGARYTPTFGERQRWGLILRGDIGAGDSDLTWLAQIGGSYRFGRRWQGALVYRYLQTDYSDASFKYDVALKGIGFGAAYRW